MEDQRLLTIDLNSLIILNENECLSEKGKDILIEISLLRSKVEPKANG